MSLSDFEIGKELGKGAFGSVYLVKRKKDKKIYAMKQVKIIGLSKREKNNAFNEVRILSSLSHKNIIGYKEAFYDNNSETLNIVMEYADDGDLNSKIKEYFKKQKYFEEPIIWKTLIQILEGLKYLHKNCIIHRDLKSANIFLTKKGVIKIGDLNVSKIIKSMGMAYTQTGTPYFASPEIWNNKPYDYKCDIWSAGCIIYEMARFHVPFRAGSMRELYNNVMKGLYPPIPLKYSHELKNIIKNILVINPELRPTANELLNCNIIKQKRKELNLINDECIEMIEKIDNILVDTIKKPNKINYINKKINEMKKNKNKGNEISINNENDIYSQKNIYTPNNCQNEKFVKNKKIFENLIEERKDNINNKDSNYNYNILTNNLNRQKNNLYLNNNNIKSDWNTNNFISKIFKKNNIFKINNITNLINNNIIIVNNNESKNNINKDNNNKNNYFFPKKNTTKNKKSKNPIPYVPKSSKKMQKMNDISKNKAGLLNSSRYNSMKTDINPSQDYDNSNLLNYHNIYRNNSANRLLSDLSENKYIENNKIYYHKKLIGKRSFSSNNLNNKKHISSLKINIPKNGRNLKRKILRHNFSHNNIYTNSLILNEKINNKISTNNIENGNISKIEINSYKDLKLKKFNNITTDRNEFNSLIYRNKYYPFQNINSIEYKKRDANIFNTYNNQNLKNESSIKTDENNFHPFKRESSLKILNELNNFSLKDEQSKIRHKKKNIYLNNLEILLNINRINIKERTNIYKINNNNNEERVIMPYGRKVNSHRTNSCNNYLSIKNKLFDNNSIGNEFSLNQVNIKTNKKNSNNNQKIKHTKYFEKYILPKPSNYINDKYSFIDNNSNHNLNNNIRSYNQKDYINSSIKKKEKLDLFEFNKNKTNKNIIRSQYENNFSQFKKKNLGNNYSYKNNNLHKIFYDKLNMNNELTERDNYNESQLSINSKDKNIFGVRNISIIRRNYSAISKKFSENNKLFFQE